MDYARWVYSTVYTHDYDGRVITEQLPDPDGAGPQSVYVTTYGYNSAGDLVYQQFMDASTKSWTYSSTLHLPLTQTVKKKAAPLVRPMIAMAIC